MSDDFVDLVMRRPKLILALVAIGCGVYFGQSMFYTVAASEEAVVQRFGAYERTTGPGLHFKLPAGVENYTKIPVMKVQTMEFGFSTARAGKRTRYQKPSNAHKTMARMLTGDLSLAHVEWTVLYRVNDAKAYLFNIGGTGRTQADNVANVIRDVAENIMRGSIGDISIDEAITTGREQVGATGKIEMQARLDQLGCGVTVVRVDVQQAQPPDPVVDAWDSVNRARQDKERIINEAKGERNEVVPAARGDQKRAIREAEGYAIRVTQTATGLAAAFASKAAEYIKNPNATETRIYIESMQRALSKADVTIIDTTVARSVLPILDLNGGVGAPFKRNTKGGE